VDGVLVNDLHDNPFKQMNGRSSPRGAPRARWPGV